MAKRFEHPNIAGRMLEKYGTSPQEKHVPNYQKWTDFAERSAIGLDLEGKNIKSEIFPGNSWDNVPDNNLIEGKSANGFWQAKKFIYKKQNGDFQIEERVVQESEHEKSFSYSDDEEFEAVKTQSELIVRLPNGNQVRLNDLLPPGYNFRPDLNTNPFRAYAKASSGQEPASITHLNDYSGANAVEGFGFSLDAEKQEIKYENLDKPGAFLALFHEIGHAWDMSESKRIIGVTANMLDLQKRYKKLQPFGAKQTAAHETVQVRRVGRNNTQQPLLIDKELMIALIKELSDAEQGPSQYAAQLVKMLRKKDFDLEPNLTDADFLANFRVGLANYQAEFESFLLTEQDKEKLRPYSFLNLQREFDFK